jgi:hypothetical protein
LKVDDIVLIEQAEDPLKISSIKIAAAHLELHLENAYILELLHDIRLREGITGLRNVKNEYNFITAKGYADAAYICLAQSYPLQDADAGSTPYYSSTNERQFIAQNSAQIKYTVYDRLIQLRDAIYLPRVVEITFGFAP